MILLNPYQGTSGFEAGLRGVERAIGLGQAVRQQQLAQQQAQQQQLAQQQLQGIASQFSTLPQEQQLGLISQASALSPQVAQGLAGVYEQQQLQRQQEAAAIQAQKDKEFQISFNLAKGVKNAAPEMKAQLYKSSLKFAADRGMDISQFPPEYSPEVEPILDAIIAQGGGMPVAEEPKALTKIGQARQDLRRGRITQEEFDQIVEAEMREKVPVTQITVGGYGPTAFEEELGKGEAKAFMERKKIAREAQQNLSMINELEKALLDKDAYYGVGAAGIQKAKQAAKLFGVNVKGLEKEAIMNAVGAKLAMQARVPGTGSVSDYETKKLEETVPDKAKTREQNLAISEIFKKQEQRKVELMYFEEEYVAEHGNYIGLDKARRKFVEENRLFSNDDFKRYEKIFEGEKKKNEIQGINIDDISLEDIEAALSKK